MSALSRARRGVLAVAAIALPLSLLPLASASADPAPPQFVYQDTGTVGGISRVLSSANADGTTPTVLLPAGYQATSFDVSQDGQTELVGLCHGSVADCTNTGTLNGWFYNTTYSLLLVHHDAGYGTVSRVLSTWWDTRATLTATGDPVWIVDGVLYTQHFDYSTSAWASSLEFPVSSTGWTPPGGSNGWTDALAVSEDGTQVAVVQDDGAASPTYYVKAGALAGPNAGATPYATKSFPKASDRQPAWSTFTFLDDTHLAASAYLNSDSPEYSVGGQDFYPLYTDVYTLDGSGGTVAENTALKDTYQLHHFADSSGWYAWQDHSNGTKDVSSYALVTGDLTTTGTTAVGAFTDRTNGESTVHYTPVVATPPVLGAVDSSSKRSAPHTYMALRSSIVGSNAVNYFWVENDYYQNPTSNAYDANNAAVVSVGELQYSYDKVHWLHSVNTQGANQKKVGTFTSMGSTQKLTRNTWFRWYYKGDLMTAPGSTSARLVKVAPTITVKIARSGTKRTVYGSVLRSRGKISLLHKVGTRYKLVATVAMTSKGAYSFGKRVLAKGTYEVVSLADAGWAASAKVFKI